jgi:hypothetical protein
MELQENLEIVFWYQEQTKHLEGEPKRRYDCTAIRQYWRLFWEADNITETLLNTNRWEMVLSSLIQGNILEGPNKGTNIRNLWDRGLDGRIIL